MKTKTIKRIIGVGVVCLLCAPIPVAQAKDYLVDYPKSKIVFSGTNADKPFDGTFGSWTAEIHFDPENLASSKLIATFNLASAKTGDVLYDGTLPQEDWFDVKNHPQADFVSTGIAPRKEGGYTAKGNLTLRGITKPVTFNFTLSDLKVSPVKATGSFIVNRLDFDLGKKSDASAEWVGRDIAVHLDITATPTP